MILSDIAVKRPVLATVMSLLIVVFGTVAFLRLPLRELPDVDPPVVSVSTVYRGASASIVETRVTQVIEDRITGIEGIDTITSSSQDGRSRITIEFSLSRDIEAAANDVRNAVSRVLNNLPEETEPPEVSKADADSSPIMWLNMSSSRLTSLELTDFAQRYIVDSLSVIDGVARVQVGGGQRYAVRVWLDRQALAARGLTVGDVEAALRRDNVELPAGRIETGNLSFSIRVERAFNDAAAFAELTITRGPDGHLVRLGEVAKVEIGPEERRVAFRGNGKPQIGLGVVKQSKANTLDVAKKVRIEVARLNTTLPGDIKIDMSYDSSIFIESAINEVYRTLAITGALVIAVIYLFLGNIRAALIPAVTVPVCLIGAFMVLYALGATINMMTLLALVLAIGLVVDDAIVVLENVQRRVDLGEPPLVAAYHGARQVGFAVLATTTVLVAVFVPIVFLEGTIGRLFAELGIAAAAAVVFSMFVALTLSPMMCSKLLKPHAAEGPLSRAIHRATETVQGAYRDALDLGFRNPLALFAVFALVVLSALVLFAKVPSELAPGEDRGVFMVSVSGPEGASFDYTAGQMEKVEAILLDLVERKEANRVLIRVPGSFGSSEDFNSGFGLVVLVPWGERDSSVSEVVGDIGGKLSALPGVRAFPIVPQGVGRGGGSRPVQFVIGGSNYDELAQWRDKIVARAAENPKLLGIDADLKETKPQLRVEIDTRRAADLGVSVLAIGRTLESMLGTRRATTYVSGGEEYDVILQGKEENRRSRTDLTNLFVRSDRTGELVPLSNLVRLTDTAGPNSLNRFNRMRAVTITASLAPDYTLGEALGYLNTIVREELPPAARVDYAGQSREFFQASGALYLAFGLALVVVFLVLAAQFESFVHPFVIILTVPLAVAGALYGLFMVGSSLNIYSQIGVVMLIGLAAKNGILIVEFANQLRDGGMEFRKAITEASVIRLRPIVMTSLSTAVGALPLVLASGAGAASRMTIGIVIFAGVLFATLLTLFMVPVLYDLLGRRTRSPEAVAHELEALEKDVTPSAHAAGE